MLLSILPWTIHASAIDQCSTGHEAVIVIDPKNALLFGNEGQRISTKIKVVA